VQDRELGCYTVLDEVKMRGGLLSGEMNFLIQKEYGE
jgi:hypothetical protein